MLTACSVPLVCIPTRTHVSAQERFSEESIFWYQCFAELALWAGSRKASDQLCLRHWSINTVTSLEANFTRHPSALSLCKVMQRQMLSVIWSCSLLLLKCSHLKGGNGCRAQSLFCEGTDLTVPKLFFLFLQNQSGEFQNWFVCIPSFSCCPSKAFNQYEQ